MLNPQQAHRLIWRLAKSLLPLSGSCQIIKCLFPLREWLWFIPCLLFWLSFEVAFHTFIWLGYLVSYLPHSCLWQCECCRAPESALLDLLMMAVASCSAFAKGGERGACTRWDTFTHLSSAIPGSAFHSFLITASTKAGREPQVMDARFQC